MPSAVTRATGLSRRTVYDRALVLNKNKKNPNDESEKTKPDTPNVRRQRAVKQGRRAKAMRAGCCVPRAIVCWPEIFVIRWARLTLLCGAGVC